MVVIVPIRGEHAKRVFDVEAIIKDDTFKLGSFITKHNGKKAIEETVTSLEDIIRQVQDYVWKDKHLRIEFKFV